MIAVIEMITIYILILTLYGIERTITGIEYVFENYPDEILFLCTIGLVYGIYSAKTTTAQNLVNDESTSEEDSSEEDTIEEDDFQQSIHEKNLTEHGFQQQIPLWAIDPVTKSIMVTPVILSSGITLDQTTADKLLQIAKRKKRQAVCPITWKPFSEYVKIFAFRDAIEDWVKQTITALKENSSNQKNLEEWTSKLGNQQRFFKTYTSLNQASDESNNLDKENKFLNAI